MAITVDVFEKQIKILLFDSAPDGRSNLRLELQAAHYNVITVENEDETVLLAGTVQPDLILLSMGKSGLHRLDVFEELRSNDVTAAIPVIFLVDDQCIEDIDRILVLGAWDYVVRPFELNELKARIRNTVFRIKRHRDLCEEERAHVTQVGMMLLHAVAVPVTKIQGLADLMTRRPLNGDRENLNIQLRSILMNAEKLSALINDFGFLLGPGEGFEPLDLIGTVRSFSEAADSVLQQSDRNLQLKLPENKPVMIRGQRRSLVLALKYMAGYLHNLSGTGNTLAIKVIPTGDRVRISMEIGQSRIPPIRESRTSTEGNRGNSDPGIEPGHEDLSLEIAKLVAERHSGVFRMLGHRPAGGCAWMDFPLLKNGKRV